MVRILFERTFSPTSLLGCLALLIFGVLLVWGGDKEKDDRTLEDAAIVLHGMRHDSNVPSTLLARAVCVVVMPEVKNSGTDVGGSGGRGPMSCRTGADFTGNWSAPAIYSVGGGSVGLQLGASSSDYVLLVMDQRAVDALLSGKTKLGTDLTAAAGPSGPTAVGATGSDVLTYARARGLFVGVSMEGATLEPDTAANKRLYGKDLNARDILIANTVATPPSGRNFISSLSGTLARGGR